MRIVKAFIMVSLMLANLATAASACCLGNMQSSPNKADAQIQSVEAMPCHQVADDMIDPSTTLDDCKCQSCTQSASFNSAATSTLIYTPVFISQISDSSNSFPPALIYHPPKHTS